MMLFKLCEDQNTIFYRGTNYTDSEDIFDNSSGIGIHFTRNYEQAKTFGRYVVAVHLIMNNPATLEDWRNALNQSSGGNPRAMAVKLLQKAGYDSIDNPAYETIVFSKQQIKVINLDY